MVLYGSLGFPFSSSCNFKSFLLSFVLYVQNGTLYYDHHTSHSFFFSSFCMICGFWDLKSKNKSQLATWSKTESLRIIMISSSTPLYVIELHSNCAFCSLKFVSLTLAWQLSQTQVLPAFRIR